MNQGPTNHPKNRHSVAIGAIHSPKRISITVSYEAYQRLLDRSDREGRSLSNLAAFLLESVIKGQYAQKKLAD